MNKAPVIQISAHRDLVRRRELYQWLVQWTIKSSMRHMIIQKKSNMIIFRAFNLDGHVAIITMPVQMIIEDERGWRKSVASSLRLVRNTLRSSPYDAKPSIERIDFS